MVTLERLHQLVDALPEEVRDAAARVLEALSRSEPLSTLETAPLREEPESDAERELVEQALAELERGEVVSHAEVRRELGL